LRLPTHPEIDAFVSQVECKRFVCEVDGGVLVPVWVMVMADRWAPSFRSHNFKLFEKCQVQCSYLGNGFHIASSNEDDGGTARLSSESLLWLRGFGEWEHPCWRVSRHDCRGFGPVRRCNSPLTHTPFPLNLNFRALNATNSKN
jgi:hypothetical protein